MAANITAASTVETSGDYPTKIRVLSLEEQSIFVASYCYLISVLVIEMHFSSGFSIMGPLIKPADDADSTAADQVEVDKLLNAGVRVTIYNGQLYPLLAYSLTIWVWSESEVDELSISALPLILIELVIPVKSSLPLSNLYRELPVQLSLPLSSYHCAIVAAFIDLKNNRVQEQSSLITILVEVSDVEDDKLHDDMNAVKKHTTLHQHADEHNTISTDQTDLWICTLATSAFLLLIFDIVSFLLLYFDGDQNGGLNLALQTNSINFGMSPMGLLEIYTTQMKLQVFGYPDNDPNTEMSYPYFEIMGKRKESIAATSFLCSCYVDDACFMFAESAIQNSGKSSALTDTIRIVQDLKAQVDMLKKENSVLLAESPYVSYRNPALWYEQEGEPSQLAAVDIFVSTVDPLKEPPLVTANTVLSILGVNYLVDKVSCYVSDDRASMLSFESLSETSEFARKWVPFCKNYNIEPRAPEWYFAQKIDYLKVKIQPTFVKDRRAMKREYEEFKIHINGFVAKAQKVPDEGWIMQDGTPWPGNNTRDHPGMRLIGLKNIFARKLPNMPKEYIVRLVMDRETDDSFLADLSVVLATGQINPGAPCRGERLAKGGRAGGYKEVDE
ncbi:hypothetical protein L1987_20985 [Smallanthus sonchifolius]|uniref:Uncharacterized protein n=1 Tax=Smallanthus sonchifolius TaxID=185202 RepID=A0ACB9ITV6_9ASTR|nr:hypothetical protein L1987_20985 [Smallanthus sonchifolius]